ncbi:hypothetical protein QBC47DRAFT_417239 [Echria macrotheca]|uniref:Uncharacterized protein n=1 Tax=Echria macrotheca TaxID=438768 RepID=A0AAJ0F2M4_9PEZI|nr:hypothetical protein QBC47DRAFT_417239 [Echria macrotheca]
MLYSLSLYTSGYLVNLLGLGLQAGLLYLLVSASKSQNPEATCASASTDSCGIQGNSDFYGLGIRIDNEIIFTVALLMAMLFMTLGQPCTLLPDLLVVTLATYGNLKLREKYGFPISQLYTDFTLSASRAAK